MMTYCLRCGVIPHKQKVYPKRPWREKAFRQHWCANCGHRWRVYLPTTP